MMQITDWIPCEDGTFVRLAVPDDGGENEILADVYFEEDSWWGSCPSGMEPINGQVVMYAFPAEDAETARRECDEALTERGLDLP